MNEENAQVAVAGGPASGILGRKIGMTQVFEADGTRVPVTVIEAGPCPVLQVKTRGGSDNYDAVQLGFGEKKPKRTTRPMMGHFAQAGATPKRFVREFRSKSAPRVKLGDTVTVSVLDGARLVDVQGVTKGKGFAGGIKRWGFHRQPMSHGNSRHHRAIGSIGRIYGVYKGVPKGKKMPGHLGVEKVTTRGLRLVRADPERNLLLVKGAVPGPNGGYLVIRRSLKDPSLKEAPEKFLF